MCAPRPQVVRRAGAFAALALACAFMQFPPASTGAGAAAERLTAKARLEAIRRAQVWFPADVASKDLRAGPGGPGAFEPRETIACEYRDEVLAGKSPKFSCVKDGTDKLKVKYGVANGEVFGEVAATRLFWALGFPADRMYSVRVECRNCPVNPHDDRRSRDPLVLFDPAAVERKLAGRALELFADSGWSWRELDLVDESAGGAPRAQRDALKLLAVFLQHTDTKPAQQRLMCLDEETATDPGVCAHPIMMVNDLGLTFGRANLFNRNVVGSVNFEQWSRAPVWSDPGRCVGNLPVSQTGSLDNPRISEAGRKFLADLLVQLTDAQLTDLFDVARFPERTATPRAATVADWVELFKRKRSDIVNAHCPS